MSILLLMRNKKKRKAQYILDKYQLAELGAHYSVDRQLYKLAVYAYKVRRSSDDALLNIEFVKGEVNNAQAEAFCVGTSGYIDTLYDNVNGNHVAQSDPTKQPLIVSNGKVVRDFDTVKASALWPTFASASGVNLVTNGDFNANGLGNDTTGWSITAASMSATNKVLSVVGSGTAANPRVNRAINLVAGKRYLFSVKIKVDNALCTSVSISTFGGGGLLITQNTPTSGQIYTLTTVLTSSSTGSYTLVITHNYADSATASGKTMEVQEVTEIDVTDYGKPAMQFDGSNDCLINTANQASVDITGQPLYLNAVLNVDSAATLDGYLLDKRVSTSTLTQYALIYLNTNPHITSYLEKYNK